VHDEAVFVARYVKNDPVVGDEVHGASKVDLDVRGTLPIGVPNVGKPSLERATRLRMTMPEGP
jgi:hypothetical protein